jgi:signal transduction histidine kinase
MNELLNHKAMATPVEKEQPSILIVDDILKNIQLLVTILSQEGYNIHFATDGQHALESLQQHDMDLILLDIMMPGMDGFEVMNRLREQREYDAVPVIFLTAKDSVEDKVRAFDLGAADYITKPFEAAEVLARIRSQLELKQARETIDLYNRHLESELERRTSELVRSERQAIFGQLVQGIVHNLRGPISVIGGNAQMLRMKFGSDELTKLTGRAPDLGCDRCRGYVFDKMDMIEQALDNLQEMVNTLLEKSRGGASNTPTRVDLNEVVRNEVDFLMADMSFKHKVRRSVQLAEEPLMVDVVRGEIAQVFENLVRNAVDAMHGQQEATLKVSTRRENGNAVLEVCDNGPGVPEEVAERIFEPFFTTKTVGNGAGTTGLPAGTGLGLWMSREAAHRARGELELDSEAGEGAVFRLVLPLAETAPA